MRVCVVRPESEQTSGLGFDKLVEEVVGWSGTKRLWWEDGGGDRFRGRLFEEMVTKKVASLLRSRADTYLTA